MIRRLEPGVQHLAQQWPAVAPLVLLVPQPGADLRVPGVDAAPGLQQVGGPRLRAGFRRRPFLRRQALLTDAVREGGREGLPEAGADCKLTMASTEMASHR